jgi:hypothetical protein
MTNKEIVMADAENIENSADAQQETSVKDSSLTAEQIIALQDELAATKANLEKSRRGEKFNQTKRAELESQLKEFVGGENFKTKYEATSTELMQLKDTLKNQLIDSVLKDKLTEANARSVQTVMKIVDRTKVSLVDGQVDTKSVEALIEELKKTDSVLFQEVQTPSLKRTGETTPVASFKTEMSAAKSPAEVQKILAKYGMGSTI